jgi:Zn-dependent alcohol dehydrogenase
VPIPDDIPFDSAAVLACAVITGFGAVVNTAQVSEGQSVVVVGTGGVGLNAVQAASLVGARPVIALDISSEKLNVALAFGATHGFDARDSAVESQVREVTAGRGADVVVITAGAGAAVEQGLRMIRRAGTVVVVGMPGFGATSKLDGAQFAHDGQRILGSKMGSTRPALDIQRLISLYQQRRLKLDELVTRSYPLDQINEATRSASRGEAIRNVIVFSG